MTPAKQAAAEISDMVARWEGGGTRVIPDLFVPIIQRAIFQEVSPLQAVIDARGKEITRLLSSQRPYVEWIMKHGRHGKTCPWAIFHPRGIPAGGPECTCGFDSIRDELRKQVGGEHG